MIRRNKYLRHLTRYFLEVEIIEGLIENPVGNTDDPTFMDTVCELLENAFNKPNEQVIFGTDLYYTMECMSLALESLQNAIDMKIAEITPVEVIDGYRVTRWLDSSHALISMNPIRTTR